jgi:hypothetical protein
MKFLLDMNLAPRWTELLDAAEIEATHWSRIGDPGASDYELLNWAAANDSCHPGFHQGAATERHSDQERPAITGIRRAGP